MWFYTIFILACVVDEAQEPAGSLRPGRFYQAAIKTYRVLETQQVSVV